LPLWFSLDCPFFIAPLVFSGLSILNCTFGFLWIVHSSLPLWFSLTFIQTYSFKKYRCNNQIKQNGCKLIH
jgi:hypothetical protein